jgi:hypothetical protein
MEREPGKIRYYLHGDQKEDNSNLWYCARCDAFVLRDHFYLSSHAWSKTTEFELYLSDKSRLDVILKNLGDRHYRPEDPPNCVA